jgi:hypothetical protein
MLAGSQSQSPHFASLSRSGPGIALLTEAMPQQIFYLLITLSIVAGFLLVRVVTDRIGRRRKSRLIERGVAEYLSQKVAAKA